MIFCILTLSPPDKPSLLSVSVIVAVSPTLNAPLFCMLSRLKINSFAANSALDCNAERAKSFKSATLLLEKASII